MKIPFDLPSNIPVGKWNLDLEGTPSTYPNDSFVAVTADFDLNIGRGFFVSVEEADWDLFNFSDATFSSCCLLVLPATDWQPKTTLDLTSIATIEMPWSCVTAMTSAVPSPFNTVTFEGLWIKKGWILSCGWSFRFASATSNVLT